MNTLAELLVLDLAVALEQHLVDDLVFGHIHDQSATGLAQNHYTAGLGLRTSNFFLDVAGVYTRYNTYYSPYTLNNYSEPVVQVKNDRFTTTLTAGFTF